MMTAPCTRPDLLAAQKAAAGMAHLSAGYAGAVEPAAVATVLGDALAGVSGNIAPIAWPTSSRSRNIVAPSDAIHAPDVAGFTRFSRPPVVTPAA